LVKTVFTIHSLYKPQFGLQQDKSVNHNG
jgi:hypothetical protein